jgi:hypothetical protein
MENKYELVNSMSACGVDETDAMFFDEGHRDSTPIELVSDSSEFFSDYLIKK